MNNIFDFTESVVEWLIKLTPLLTVTISAVISYFTSKAKAKTEIRKFALENERKDKKYFEQLFSEYMKITDSFSNYHFDATKSEAISINTKLLSVAPKSFTPILEQMDKALTNKDYSSVAKIRNQLLIMYSEKIEDSN